MRPEEQSKPTGTPRERILDAASAVFAEEGYGGARVDEIARRAGVNKAMLYYHVGDKQALFSDVLTRNFGRALAGIREAVSAPGNATERLRAVVGAIVDLLGRHPDHPRIMLREIAAGADNLPAQTLERILAIFGLIQDLLEDGVEGGEFRRTDPVLTHLMIVGTIVFMAASAPVRERVAEDLPESLPSGTKTDLAEFVTTMLLQGLEARSSTGGAE